ncbi:MAG: hypothetical protein FWE21_04240 [Defluviitaleaceae bacterium]|nr:hypothetical protein [Defluviitaleaceae bacterium]
MKPLTRSEPVVIITALIGSVLFFFLLDDWLLSAILLGLGVFFCIMFLRAHIKLIRLKNHGKTYNAVPMGIRAKGFNIIGSGYIIEFAYTDQAGVHHTVTTKSHMLGGLRSINHLHGLVHVDLEDPRKYIMEVFRQQDAH